MRLLAAATAGALAAGTLAVPASAAGPTVASTSPADKAVGVPTTAKPTVTFGTEIKPASVRYSWRTDRHADVPASFRVDAANRTVTFAPRNPLTAGGKYTITVTARDAATNTTGRSYAFSFTTGTPDTSAPTAPGTPTASGVGATSATLAWAPSTDNVGVVGYDIHAAGTATPIASTTGATGKVLDGLTPSTAYSFTVRARDAAGNVSPASAAAAVTTATPPDAAAPTAPGKPTFTEVTATGAKVSWAASTDNVGVASYQVLGGPEPMTVSGTAATLANLTPQTAYSITVQARDAAGNASGASAAAVLTTPALPMVNASSGRGIPGATANTLVVYDSSDPTYGFLGGQYATMTANLSSHFGDWTAQPVVDYAAGTLNNFDAVVYVGALYDEPLPPAFLADVTATTKPVVWMYNNIWQLTAFDPNFAANRGFTWSSFDFSTIDKVQYEGRTFTRNTLNGAGLMQTAISDPAKAQPVGEAVRADGTTLPWGVRSGNFTYLSEIPYSYINERDRYVAFTDLLIDVLAPATAARHRALVRIEDVGPDSEPAELDAISAYLGGKHIPFSVAVYPRYRNPLGTDNGGVAQDYTLSDRPLVVAALKRMQNRGGTLLMHGYTHQYEAVANPYNGVSADDFEFYAAHIDANNNVIYDGPVPTDSEQFVQGRIDASFAQFEANGLGRPTIFEFPHYAASDLDNRVMVRTFQKRYDRGIYASGALRGGAVDHSRIIGQFFPYQVRDIYGALVIPENLGNIELEAFNNHPARLPADLVAAAQANAGVRDGVASFFYHTYLGTSYLQQTVEGIEAAGFTFVAAGNL
ncbi:DUF2334 domain-containing protein [Pilimelia anulata]|nr:DUF2334 domain-containing protein [Pilimelia anulata]